jgi:hypothetical protein
MVGKPGWGDAVNLPFPGIEATQKFPFNLPPPRGGLRSLSVAVDCIATKS